MTVNPTTLDELNSKITEILPDAWIGEDNEGQLIVYTNLKCGVPHRIISEDVPLIEME